MSFSQSEQEEGKKRGRPRISGGKASGGNRSRNREKVEPTTDTSTPTNGNSGGSTAVLEASDVIAVAPIVAPPAEEIQDPVATKPSSITVTPPPPLRTEPKYNPNDGTLELPELDFELNVQFPNTDFGAGEGPGTVDKPRILNCGTIECAYASDVGRQRTNNEDSAVAFLGMVERSNTTFGFFALADGMGGHENGEVASNIAVRKMMDGVMRDFYLPTKEGRPLGIAGETPTEIMVSLINDANQAIVTEGMSRYRVSMGTTLSCVILYGPVGIIGHVGDSRIYVVERETKVMRQLTRDHSLVQRMVELGQLTQEETLDHPQRSFLYMSLGQRGLVNPDTETMPLADASHLLLCSDGLWDMLDDATIAQILTSNAEPDKACQQLIEAANEAGGGDNVTVIIIKL
ncbi:MAG: protein phosphatase 2C domain-containing protein [Chloroflexota bacterium]|nr:serine/threonine-protein phosphatase [Chloroflexota bacterium]